MLPVIRFFSLLLLVVLVTCRGTAHAQERLRVETPSTLQNELSGPAREDYSIARALFEGGDFVASFAKFELAYERSKNPRLLWNMAACKKSLHQYAATEALLESFVAVGESTLSKESVAKAVALLGTLRALLGTVRFSGVEAATRVTLDERSLTSEQVGRLLRLEIGEHVVTARMPGRQELLQRFTLVAGQELEIRVALLPLSAKLTVVTEEKGEIWLDGRSVALGRFNAEVAPGSHTLRVSASGRKTFATTVDLEAGANRALQINLERTPGPVWPWVAGGVVVAAGLITGGYFLLRRDDARTSPSGTLPPNAIQLP